MLACCLFFLLSSLASSSFLSRSLGRLIKKIYADGKYERFGYDGDGLLYANVSARDSITDDVTARYNYDENHNVTGINYKDSTPDVNYFYDDYNRVIARGDGIGAWSYAYDAESRLLSVDGPLGNDTLTYTYDDIGRRTSVQLQGGETVGYIYDALGRLTEIKPGAGTFGYTYPANSPSPLPVSLTRPNGSFTSYQYDAVNRLTELANKKSTQQLIIADAFTYNTKDMRENETITNGVPITNFTANLTTYSYNNVNQLLSTVRPTQAFAYDADGNMTKGYTPEGYVFTANYDAGNRLKTIDYADSAFVARHTDFTIAPTGCWRERWWMAWRRALSGMGFSPCRNVMAPTTSPVPMSGTRERLAASADCLNWAKED